MWHRLFVALPARVVDRALPWYWALVAALTILCVVNVVLVTAWTYLRPPL